MAHEQYKLIAGIRSMAWLHKPTKDPKINKKVKELKEKQKKDKKEKDKDKAKK